MKHCDWSPYPKKILVECFAKHCGVEPFRIKAGTQEEAEAKVIAILEQHHPNFLRRSQGLYNVRFTLEPRHDIIKHTGANRLDRR